MSNDSYDDGVGDATWGEADEAYDVLADRRRRFAIRCLGDHDATMTLADLADEVAILEHGEPLTEIPAEAVMDIYLALYHTHVPKLSAAGIVEYDQGGDLVAPKDLESVESYLSLLDDRDR